MNTFPTEPRRLLIVEDEPNDVELIRLALQDLNFAGQVDVVHDGEQALHYLLGESDRPPSNPLPRAVLLDLKLPKVSGIRVLQTLRANPRTRNLVVVVMTSSQEDADLNVCYGLGVNSYVVKPLDFEQFTTITQQVGLYWMQINRPPLLLL